VIFVDTSAFFALADRADQNHHIAKVTLKSVAESESFFTHNYVIIESVALMQRRLGISVVQRFLEDMKSFDIHWVSQELQIRAVQSLLQNKKRSVSLVDYVSFEVMRARKSDTAFVFDADFQKAGFKVLSNL
jgi:uncharacterized protein